LIRRAWSPKEASSGAPRRHVARLARTARRREGPRGAMAAELRGGASRWRAGTRALHPHSRRRLPASRMRTAPCWWAGGGGCPRGAQPRARVEAAAAGPVPQRHVAGSGRAGCCASAFAVRGRAGPHQCCSVQHAAASRWRPARARVRGRKGSSQRACIRMAAALGKSLHEKRRLGAGRKKEE